MARVDLTSAPLAGVALAGVGVAVLALVLAVTAQVRLTRMRRRFDVLWAGGETDVASLAAAQEQRPAVLAGQVAATRADVDVLRGDGLVISSIHARGESRTHAKGLVGGGSETTLTPEEQEALRAARPGRTASTRRVSTEERR